LLAAQAQSDSDMFSELEQWITEHLKSDHRDACRTRPHEPQELRAALCEDARPDTRKGRRGRTHRRCTSQARGIDRSNCLDCEDCGFSDEEQMRTAFVRVLGVPPREYRKHFAPS